MKVEELKQEIEMPEGIEAKVDGSVITVKGKNAEVSRDFKHPKVQVTVADGKVVFSAKKATKKEKTLLGTFKAHVNNMFKGAVEGHEYKLKVCSSHFPMSVAINNGVISVKNYLGEKVPRELKLKDGTDVKVDGDIITVTSSDKEKAGQVAADIEKLMRITNRDRRIFQDGIYIISKDGKEL